MKWYNTIPYHKIIIRCKYVLLLLSSKGVRVWYNTYLPSTIPTNLRRDIPYHWYQKKV
jgi:hypothetical protein